MKRPVIAIVGRPNVGKSTIFNRLAGERKAIVEDRPGVTRDRLYATVEWFGRPLTIIDTGGLELYAEDAILKNVRLQAEFAIDEADIILFVVDGAEGLTAADETVADYLRRSGKPVVLTVNKVDHPLHDARRYEFYALGLGEPYPISAAHGTGFNELFEAITALLPPFVPEEDDHDAIHLALVGRPNVGKSSLVNALLGEERVIVSDVPGTTRDAVDTPLTYNDTPFVLIDTAGMRRRGRIYEKTEKYSVLRAQFALERSDVAALILDATTGLVEQDKHIAGFVEKAGRGLLIVVNKWDAVQKDDKTHDRMVREIREAMPFIDYAPIVFISAKTGLRMYRVLDLAKEVAENHAFRFQTSLLNTVIRDAVQFSPPPARQGKALKIRYATQVGVRPPTIALFVNDPELMHFSYVRYLENQLRQAFPLIGTPLRLVVRESSDRSGR